MQYERFPVLGEAEDHLVGRFAVGLSDRTARTLTYLVARRVDAEVTESFASKLAVRVGTGLGRTTTDDALDELERRGLVEVATPKRETAGRPTTTWRAAAATDETVARIHETHADALLDRANSIATAFEEEEDGPRSDEDGGLQSDEDSWPQSDENDTVVENGSNECTPADVTVALNWDPNGFHAPLFVAARGPYATRGIDASFTVCRGSRAAVERVAEGRADVALAGAASVLRARADGRAVVPVALLYQRAATALYTTRAAFDRPFESIEQLRGRRVAMPPGSETEALCRLFLSQAGVGADVTIVETGGEERHALFDGDADVVTGMATDLVDLRADGHTVDSILVADHFPAYGPAVLVHERTLRERRAFLARFLRATLDGWTTAIRDTDAAAEAVAATGDRPADIERRRFEMALDRFAESDATNKHGWGWQSADGWSRLRTALEQADVLVGET